MKRLLTFSILFSMIGLSYAQKRDQYLLKKATIIDGEASIKPYIGFVLIENGYVTSITKKAPRHLPKTVHIIDCTGKYIMPGLIESHVHLATIDLTDTVAARKKTDSIVTNMLRHGITSVRDMAGDVSFLNSYKTAISAGKILGPDIFTAAQFAGPEYFDMINIGKKKHRDTPWYRSIKKGSTTEEIQQAVLDAKNLGITGIKIYSDLDKKTIQIITHEAHKAGMLAWSHSTVFPAKPIDAVDAGVNSVSHAIDLAFHQLPGDTLNVNDAWTQMRNVKFNPDSYGDLFTKMKEKNIVFDPTIFHASNNGFSIAFVVTKLAHQQGVKIAAGTDWIYPTKDSPVPLIDEMKLLIKEGGLSNLEVIEAATFNGAQVTGLSDRGLLRKGELADILILNENPINDIEALKSPKTVLKHGVIVFEN